MLIEYVYVLVVAYMVGGEVQDYKAMREYLAEDTCQHMTTHLVEALVENEATTDKFLEENNLDDIKVGCVKVEKAEWKES